MMRISFSQFRLGLALVVLSSFLVSCSTQVTSQYFGKTEAPKDNVLRYISGSEPESLDPQVPTGQPEARVLMAMFDGLLEYHPKTMEPIPSIAESWEPSADGTEYTFFLRKNATFSNGAPITAKDFVYTFRRGFSPELAAQNAYLGYYIKYSEAYNSGANFVKTKDGNFLLKKDIAEEEKKDGAKPEETKSEPSKTETAPTNAAFDTDFHKFIVSPERATVAGDSFALAKEIEGSEKLKAVFKLSAKDLKDAPALADKIKGGTDDFSKYLQSKIDINILNACASADSCSDDAKQKFADALNDLMDKEAIYEQASFKSLTLSEKSQKIIKKFDDANKKVDEDNTKLDEEIGKLTDAAEKQAKEKNRKKKVGKLFYMNRFLMEEMFAAELEKSPLVSVKGEDIGVEAVDDYTFRVTLVQPAPFFLGLLPHQFFRVVHQGTVEKFEKDWTKPENIVTSGAFKLKTHKPYDEIIVVKDPTYWDAANVKLDGIEFYPMEEATTMMNLYKSNDVHALYNHTPPAAWNDVIKQYKDEYLNFPEVAIEYYTFNVKKPPTDNVKVRQAFALAVDREALAKFRKTTKPLVDFTPEGIFPKYEEARTKVYTESLKAQGSSIEAWKARIFDVKKACDLMKEAGYKAGMTGENRCKVDGFPVDQVNITYNTAESNKAVAEFMQAQWKQNLGITIPLKNMEWKTFLPVRKAVDYLGMARSGWVGDYMDPITFLNLFYKDNNDSSTGWHNPKFDKMLDDANKEKDEMKRYEMLAAAELFLMHDQPVVPMQTQATNWIKKPFIKGLYPNPGTLHAWKFIYIEKDQNKWDKNVDNIMIEKDPLVEGQIEQLTSSQKSFLERKKTETPKQ
jgi:oligopeptide transport system substrate-binding protein